MAAGCTVGILIAPGNRYIPEKRCSRRNEIPHKKKGTWICQINVKRRFTEGSYREFMPEAKQAYCFSYVTKNTCQKM